jgi:hypothetical protein
MLLGSPYFQISNFACDSCTGCSKRDIAVKQLLISKQKTKHLLITTNRDGVTCDGSALKHSTQLQNLLRVWTLSRFIIRLFNFVPLIRLRYTAREIFFCIIIVLTFSLTMNDERWNQH